MSVRNRTHRCQDGTVERRWVVDVDFQHADGRRERLRKVSPVQTKRGAEQYEHELRDALLHGTYNKREVPTFKAFVEDKWLPTYPASVGNRPSTVTEKQMHVQLYLMPVLGSVRLDRIHGEVISRLFASLRSKKVGKHGKKTLTEKTIKNVRATLRRILASAVEWGELEKLPILPRVKVPDSKWEFYGKEESDQLVAACRDDEERALLLFAIQTGARAGEQLALRWSDIDMHNRLVTFRRSSTRGIEGPTKSGRERKVPLTSELVKALQKIRHLRGPLVFCRMDGTPMRIDQLHERLWGASRRAGLREIRWHDLRHSFASQLVIGGVPLLQVKEWLGHSTITMTMRYAHLAPGGGAEWISVLERRGSGTLTAQRTEPANETE